MPPKPKYTKEEIVAAALEIAAKKGMQALTAKELSEALNTSTSPVFTVFASMQEVQAEVRRAAMARFECYVRNAKGDMPAFKKVGMQMISFAKEEPRLYQMLFMSPDGDVTSFDDTFVRLGLVANECIDTICSDYSLSEEDAKSLFEHIWIHTFGIGAMCATKMCVLSEEQISKMLTQDFTAMMKLLKSEKGEKNE